jgi:hypothetical protein
VGKDANPITTTLTGLGDRVTLDLPVEIPAVLVGHIPMAEIVVIIRHRAPERR